MADVNYSIRLEEETRERMREVPDMTDRIRDFIEREINRYEMGDNELPEERFCHQILSEYGIVGAYCLSQRGLYYRSKNYYLQNVETWFEGYDVDVSEARLQAKRIWNEWENFAGNPDEVVEDMIDIEGYTDQFYSRARDIAQDAAEEGGVKLWTLWTVIQLFRHGQSRSSMNKSSFSIKKRSIKNTLEMHGFDDDKIESGMDIMIKVGGFQNLYSSNAYTYRYIKFNDYIIDAMEEGLENHEKEVRTTVGDYCGEEPYLNQLLEITRGGDRNQYEKEFSNQEKSDVEEVVKDGSVVLNYSPSRSSTGRRSSLPSKTKCVLSPSVREIVSDAVYQHKTSNRS